MHRASAGADRPARRRRGWRRCHRVGGGGAYRHWNPCSRKSQMRDLKNLLIGPSATIREALERIDAGSMQIVLVGDSEGRLVGTVTDGDVRRGLLRGIGLDKPVSLVMNSKPTAAHISQDREWIKALMRQKLLRQIPIVDDDQRVVDLVEILDELVTSAVR